MRFASQLDGKRSPCRARQSVLSSSSSRQRRSIAQVIASVKTRRLRSQKCCSSSSSRRSARKLRRWSWTSQSSELHRWEGKLKVVRRSGAPPANSCTLALEHGGDAAVEGSVQPPRRLGPHHEPPRRAGEVLARVPRRSPAAPTTRRRTCRERATATNLGRLSARGAVAAKVCEVPREAFAFGSKRSRPWPTSNRPVLWDDVDTPRGWLNRPPRDGGEGAVAPRARDRKSEAARLRREPR